MEVSREAVGGARGGRGKRERKRERGGGVDKVYLPPSLFLSTLTHLHISLSFQ
jgi:hypothetical protein